MKRVYGALILSLTVLQFAAVLCALSKPAYGYVDPGSGLLAFQMISTTFAGAIFIVRRRIRRSLEQDAHSYRVDLLQNLRPIKQSSTHVIRFEHTGTPLRS